AVPQGVDPAVPRLPAARHGRGGYRRVPRRGIRLLARGGAIDPGAARAARRTAAGAGAPSLASREGLPDAAAADPRVRAVPGRSAGPLLPAGVPEDRKSVVE